MRVLASADSIDDAASRILEAVCRCGNWDLGELWMVDTQACTLRLEERWHRDSPSLSEFVAASDVMTFPPGVGLPGRVWSSGSPAWIEDIARDPNFLRAPQAARVGLHAAFGFPIRIRNDVIGSMLFFSPALREPDTDLLDSLDLIGSQIGHFIARVRSQQALAESEARWHRIFSGAPMGIYHSTLAGKLIDANPAIASMLRYESPEELIRVVNETSIAEVLYVDVERRSGIIRELEEHPSRWVRTETQLRCKDGALVTVALDIKQLRAGRGAAPVIEAFLVDVSERKRMERDLRESEATFRKLFEDSSDAILLIDSTGVFVECNKAALDLLKMTRQQFLFLPPARISPEVQPNGRRSSESAPEMIALAYSKGSHRFDWTCVNSAGGEFIVEVSLMPVVVKGQTMLHTSWRDITERKRIEGELQTALERVHELTLHDPLTGIFNRRYFEPCLAVELSAALRHGQALSLAMFDIDHFKAINDAYGHGTGDAVLSSLAATLAGSIRPADILARYGGEEFSLILRDTASTDAMLLVERLRAAIEGTPVRAAGVTLRVTMSCGVASLADCSEPTRDGLVGTADARLYRAKALGRNRVEGPG